MIVPATASMIHLQKDDEITDRLVELYDEVNSLNIEYIELNSINKKQYRREFKLLSLKYNKIFKDRFNLNINIKSSNTFAIIPLVNPRELDTKFSYIKDDIKTAIKQISSFKEYIEHNEIVIDLEKARVDGLDSNITFPLYIDPNKLNMITPREFTAIILHEVGHVFTLLEIYSNTNLAIASMTESLIDNSIPLKTIKKLHIGGKVTSEKDALVKIYEHITNDILNVKLATNKNDKTDTEYMADSFAVKFGLGSDLATALNKLTNTKQLTYGTLAISMGILVTLYSVVTYTILAFMINPASGIVLTLLSLVAALVYKLNNAIGIQYNRNPVMDEHGSIGYRFKKIKLELIHILRTESLDKNEKKDILHQISVLEEEIEVLEQSFINSTLGSFILPILNTNLNIQDGLALTLESLIENELYVTSAKLVTANGSNVYHGRTDPVVKELTELFKTMKENNVLENSVQFTELADKLSDIIYDRFGIPLDVMPAILFGTGNACIPLSAIDKSGLSGWKINLNSKLDPYHYLADNSTYKLIDDITKGHTLKIDTTNTKIIGLDKDRHKSVVFIEFGRDYFLQNKSDVSLTPREMTFIFLHEIGHLYTHIKALANTVRTNIGLQDSLLEYNSDVSDVVIERDDRFDKGKKALEVTTEGLSRDIKYMLFAYKSIVLNMMGMSRIDNTINAVLDYSDFDDSLGTYNTYKLDSENVADNFSAMFGGGDELVNGIRKLLTLDIESKSLIFLPVYVQILTSITNVFRIKNTSDLVRLPVIMAMGLYYASISYTTYFIYRLVVNSSFPYENIVNRIDNIKRDIIKGIRNKHLSKTEQKRIVKTIETIDDNIKKLKRAGYDSSIFNIFVPTENVGVDYKNDKRLVNTLNTLINNDLHILQMKFDIASNDVVVETTASSDNIIKYVTEYFIDTSYILWTELLKDNLVNINEILKTKNITIDYKKDMLEITSDYKLKVRYGISTISFVPIDETWRPVINLTTESFKILWHLTYDKIKVYSVDKIKLNKYKTLFVESMEYIDFNTDKDIEKYIKLINNEYHKLRDDYGSYDSLEIINNVIDNKKTDSILKVELKKLRTFIESIIDTGIHVKEIGLDLHSGNITKHKNEIIILDPIYHSISNARKVENDIDIDESMFDEFVGLKATTASSTHTTNEDELYRVYHYGEKGYKHIKTNDEASFFIGKLTREDIDRLKENGFKSYDKVTTRYVVDLRDFLSKDYDIKIKLSSTPEEEIYHKQYWSNFYKKYKDSKDFKELRKEYRRIMRKKIYGKEYFTISEYIEYIRDKDYKDVSKYLDTNIKKGNKEQYATYIPHIQIVTNNNIHINESEDI